MHQESLSAIFERMAAYSEKGDLSLGQIIRQIGDKGYGILLVVISLPSALPVFAVGYSTPFGLLLSIIGCSADVESQRPITTASNGEMPTNYADSASVVESVDPTAKVITGKVVKITDGDTLIVLDESNTQHKIRLDGIDTPETGQAFGTKAKQALGEKVFQKSVRVEWKARGRYNRIIGTIYLDDRLINLEMVEVER